MARIDTFHPLGSPFRDREARQDSSFRGSTIFLSHCHFEKALKGRTFIFNEDSMKNILLQSVLSMLFSHLERQHGAEIVKVTYETTLGCEALMKRLQTACHQSIGTRRKNAKHCFFEEYGGCYMAVLRC